MACRFEVLLNSGLPPDGPDAAMSALDCAEHLELLLSVYKPDSDFSRVNRSAAAVPTPVSLATVELLSIAETIRQQTESAFNIEAAGLSDLWGFSRRQGRKPSSAEIDEMVSKIRDFPLQLDCEGRTVTRQHVDVRINSGGIGKGYALDQMKRKLVDRGVENFLIHGGHSSILAAGNRLDLDSQNGWRIAVRHPEQAQRILGEIRLKDLALGTSGPANQFFYFDGTRYAHLIDPRTGWPAATMLSMTVLHPCAVYADALATALFVLGVDAATTYCKAHPETSFIAILPSKRLGDVEVLTCNLKESTWVGKV